MFYRESDQQQDQIARGGNALRNLILLVEDDQSTASLLIQIITQETTYQVAHASDGKTAWKFLQQVKPQLVILDYRLPYIDGLKLYERMRADKELYDVPVLLLSAALPTHEIEQHGITHFLRKPFDLEALLEMLHALILYRYDQLI
jgi:DNA-binding response OmpR family regulator